MRPPMGAGSWTYGQALQLREVGLPHAVASGRRSRNTARRACELAALGLVADRLQQSRRAMAQRTEAWLAATP